MSKRVGDKRRSASVDSAALAQSIAPPLSVGPKYVTFTQRRSHQ